ncbi:MAG: site-2 protease family protein [Ruminococcaceae bacterium]|nr:site-2 protease family protein [Oscillospiraceae bacterium]
MFFINLDIGVIWSNVWPYLLAVLLFGAIIGIHEFGHFFFAKLFKVKVNEFSLGMGPKLIKKQIGETLYAIRLLPIGGFVSMEGEDEESDNERAFGKKPAWQRFIIVAAGAILNLLLGVLVVAICLTFSGAVGTRTIYGFMPGAVSEAGGLRAGDEIVKINDTRIYSYMGISFNLVRDVDNKIDFTVIRDGEKIELKDVEFKQFEFEGKQYIQQDFQIVGEKPNVKNVIINSVLDSASIVQMVRLSLVDIVTGKYGMREISGPIGTISAIAETTSQAENIGDKILTALSFLSMITINVGVFNLLPIPALDGGRLFFIFIEMIRRKPIPPKREGIVHTVGIVILLLFMAVISIKDVIFLF